MLNKPPAISRFVNGLRLVAIVDGMNTKIGIDGVILAGTELR
jgi:hypothetical protein